MLVKLKWAIHDKSKFLDLIKDLRYYIDALRDLTPETVLRQKELVQEEVDSLSAINLKLVQEAGIDGQDDWSEAASLRLNEFDLDIGIEDWLERIEPEVDNTSDISPRGPQWRGLYFTYNSTNM